MTDNPLPPLSESELDRARAYIHLLETQAAERRTEDKTGKGCIILALIFSFACLVAFGGGVVCFAFWLAGVL
jgi:hypothetical protein